MEKKNGLDKTSIIMLAVFFALIVGFTVMLIVGAVTGKEERQTNADTEMVDMEVIVDEKPKYKTYGELADKFLEVCNAGNVYELYDMYYDDLLEKARLSMNPVPDKTMFDAGLKENMLRITGFDEYTYGCVELLDVQPPGAYASQIYYKMYGESLPFSADIVEDCVNLVVYLDNMYETNHFMVQIDGYWYFIV